VHWRRYTFALAPLLAAGIWGGMYVVSKWGFARVPPLTLGLLRVCLGAAALLVAVRGRADAPAVDPADRRSFLVLGGWVALTIATQFVGTELTTASQGSLLTVLTPVFTVILGALVLGESVGRRDAVGMTLATLGTLVVLGGRYDVRGLFGAGGGAIGVDVAVGVLALVVASLAWAGYTVWGVPVVRKYGALPAATYSTVVAIPLLAPAAFLELWVRRPPVAPMLTPESLFVVGYLGLASTAAAWVLWYTGLEYAPAGTVAVYFFAQPVVGIALGALLLGEAVGATFLLGGLVMALGVWIVSA
jgi:drug/metabolite transporter (DMT)-like permease